MSRPKYENEETLKAEREVADFLEDKWKCEMIKLPISYRLDFAAQRGLSIYSWVEVKCRDIASGTYSTIMLSLSKVQAAYDLTNATKLPALFVVCLTDGLFYTELNPTMEYEVVVGGRTVKTRDDADVEPVCMIPMLAFEKL